MLSHGPATLRGWLECIRRVLYGRPASTAPTVAPENVCNKDKGADGGNTCGKHSLGRVCAIVPAHPASNTSRTDQGPYHCLNTIYACFTQASAALESKNELKRVRSRSFMTHLLYAHVPENIAEPHIKALLAIPDAHMTCSIARCRYLGYLSSYSSAWGK